MKIHSNDWDMTLNNAHDPSAEYILIPIIHYEIALLHNTCTGYCANCYSYTAVQLLYILMYAQSSSIATASSLWCELSDQVQCV